MTEMYAFQLCFRKCNPITYNTSWGLSIRGLLQELKISFVYDDSKMSPKNPCKRHIPFSYPPIVWGGDWKSFWGWEPRLRRASFQDSFLPPGIRSLLWTGSMPAAAHALFVCGTANNCSRFLHVVFPCLLWHLESAGRGLSNVFHMLYLWKKCSRRSMASSRGTTSFPRTSLLLGYPIPSSRLSTQTQMSDTKRPQPLITEDEVMNLRCVWVMSLRCVCGGHGGAGGVGMM